MLIGLYFALPQGSTFRWDSAAPHGLLRAAGGGVVVYRRLTSLNPAQVSATCCIDRMQVDVTACSRKITAYGTLLATN